ncbi:exodeoxyribonuclease X C-terminal domain-containing protein [Clostridium saccharoperbutylacetonicum]
MDMKFGKYKDKAVAWVLLEDPNYFHWMQSQGMDSKQEYRFAMNLINKFDQMPYTYARCHGECKGEHQVTKLSLYSGMFNGDYWFCDRCSPYDCGAMAGKLSVVARFSQVLGHSQSKEIIKAMAKAKGVPDRKTKPALKNFFGY